MSRIRKCDRCSACYEPYETKFNNIGTRTYNMDNEMTGSGMDYDLCPKCREEFIDWYNAVGKLDGTDTPEQEV